MTQALETIVETAAGVTLGGTVLLALAVIAARAAKAKLTGGKR